MGFSRQEYWSGLPFPSPGDLPDPRIKPGSLALEADALTSEPPGKPTPLNPPRAPLLYDMKMVFSFEYQSGKKIAFLSLLEIFIRKFVLGLGK